MIAGANETYYCALLILRRNQPFSASGNCVVSKRTAKHVDFNTIFFRDKAAFPELRAKNSEYSHKARPERLP